MREGLGTAGGGAQRSPDLHLFDSAVVPPYRFPHCIVWTPIPFISWLYPFVGHMGVCSSAGVIYDFAGLGVSRGPEMAFGHPVRYVQLDLERASALVALPDLPGCWDRALEYSASMYDSRAYNPCSTNCHHFVQHFMVNTRYGGCSSWSILQLGSLVFFHGKFVGWTAFLKLAVPSVLSWSACLYFWRLWFLAGWAALLVLCAVAMGGFGCARNEYAWQCKGSSVGRNELDPPLKWPSSASTSSRELTPSLARTVSIRIAA